ncbi:hypothetical protein GJ496_007810, partial [Pomphorhynchus laevis]
VGVCSLSTKRQDGFPTKFIKADNHNNSSLITTKFNDTQHILESGSITSNKQTASATSTTMRLRKKGKLWKKSNAFQRE